MLFRSKNSRELAPFFAQSLLGNSTETLATQARNCTTLVSFKNYILGIPIDRVPMSKSCIFCSHLTVSCNVWGPLAKESIPLKHVLGWGGGGGGSQGGKLTLNSLLRTRLSLKHPLSFRAFKQLECMDKSRVSFWWTWMFLLLIRNQEESHLKRTMGKSWVSWRYLL